MKKRTVCMAVVLMAAAVAQAAVTVSLESGDGNDTPVTTFTYNNLSHSVGFDCGVMGTSALLQPEGTVSSSVSGSFTITWEAAKAIDASAWNFDTTTAYEIRDFTTGWGVSTLNDTTLGSGTFQLGEVFLLTFDTSLLNLSADQVLVFSISTRDTGDAFSIYQRTGASAGYSVLDVKTVAETFCVNVTVDGLQEFAIVQADAGNMIRGISIDVITVEPETMGLLI